MEQTRVKEGDWVTLDLVSTGDGVLSQSHCIKLIIDTGPS